MVIVQQLEEIVFFSSIARFTELWLDVSIEVEQKCNLAAGRRSFEFPAESFRFGEISSAFAALDLHTLPPRHATGTLHPGLVCSVLVVSAILAVVYGVLRPARTDMSGQFPEPGAVQPSLSPSLRRQPSLLGTGHKGDLIGNDEQRTIDALHMPVVFRRSGQGTSHRVHEADLGRPFQVGNLELGDGPSRDCISPGYSARQDIGSRRSNGWLVVECIVRRRIDAGGLQLGTDCLKSAATTPCQVRVHLSGVPVRLAHR